MYIVGKAVAGTAVAVVVAVEDEIALLVVGVVWSRMI
jgi:hypothetical protein